MRSMNTNALIPVATGLSASYEAVYEAFRDFVTGCHWPNVASRTEGNRLIGKIRYRNTQIERDAKKLVVALTGDEDAQLADIVAGFILIDAAEQYGWTIRRISTGYVVLRTDSHFHNMSKVNQAITARREMLSLLTVTLSQIEAHITSSGFLYEGEDE